MRAKLLTGGETAFGVTARGANLGVFLEPESSGGGEAGRTRLLQAAGLLSRYMRSRADEGRFDPALWLKAMKSVPFWSARPGHDQYLDNRGDNGDALVNQIAKLPALLGLGDDRITNPGLSADIQSAWAAARKQSGFYTINLLVLVDAGPWPGGARAEPLFALLTAERTYTSQVALRPGDWPVLNLSSRERDQIDQFFTRMPPDRIDLKS